VLSFHDRQVLELCVANKVPVRALARDPAVIRSLPSYNPELVEVVKGDVCSYSSLAKAVGERVVFGWLWAVAELCMQGGEIGCC